jgi:hypothetical protein
MRVCEARHSGAWHVTAWHAMAFDYQVDQGHPGGRGGSSSIIAQEDGCMPRSFLEGETRRTGGEGSWELLF